MKVNIGINFPEGISSSLRDFIVLVFNIEVFQIKFLGNKVPQKKKKVIVSAFRKETRTVEPSINGKNSKPQIITFILKAI